MYEMYELHELCHRQFHFQTQLLIDYLISSAEVPVRCFKKNQNYYGKFSFDRGLRQRYAALLPTHTTAAVDPVN